ncbi:MAG TPA: alkaline phosphatase PhoX [Mycobacteriales bacterium]|nr:alkaline phosphatase PhoX [Mycobacteriales bacterium]
MAVTRRQFLTRATAAGAGIALVGSVDSVFGTSPAFSAGTGYGPLIPDPDGILDLPRGFSYRIVTRTGDKLTDGGLVPGSQDGTASFRGTGKNTLLVQNHEQTSGAGSARVVGEKKITYDPGADGGTTTLEVDQKGALQRQYVSIAGTAQNCAGGLSPWGTWLTCEETEIRAGEGGMSQDHGFVFEVDPYHPENNAHPHPITGMGRFAHEALAIDPLAGDVYLTEDAGGPDGLFYRFRPKKILGGLHSLHRGGLLEAMNIPGLPDLSVVKKIGAEYGVEWKPVPDPLAAEVSTRKQFDYLANGERIAAEGGSITRSHKLEGAWWRDDYMYFVSSFSRVSSGSAADHDGQVWRFDPRLQRIRLILRFAYTPRNQDDNPDGPDNISVSPYGGVILAEDGEGAQHLVGASEDGSSYFLARNAYNDSEFTGPVFSPDGTILFANIQTPGIVLAITGPWK